MKIHTHLVLGLSSLLAAVSATAQADLQPGDSYRVLAVTDASRTADTANIAVYDSFVTADIHATPQLAALGTNWRAVASTAVIAAPAHTDTQASNGGVPIYRPDGVRIFDDYAHMWASGGAPAPHAAPEITSSGAITTAVRVWTGTQSTGSPSLPLGNAFGQSIAGNPTAQSGSWTQQAPHGQSSSFPLYAISDVLTVPGPVYPADLQPGDQFRLIFVTDSMRDATSADVADYDALAQTDAAATPALSLFHTTWQALVSTPTVNAKVHTGTDPADVGVPIYRTDGTRACEHYVHLWGTGSSGYGPLLAPIELAADGSQAVALHSRVWTGTSHNGNTSDPLGDASPRSQTGNFTSLSTPWVWSNDVLQTEIRPVYAISGVITVPVTASATAYGAGCGNPALSMSTPDTALPAIGGTPRVDLQNMATPTGVILLGLSSANIPLDVLGMPGCDLLHSSDLHGAQVSPLFGGTGYFELPLANQQSLLGMRVFLQGVVVDPDLNGLGLAVSNGVEWVIGNQ